jgi:hypothetical protein
MLRFKMSAAVAVVFALGTLGCESGICYLPTCPDTTVPDTTPPRVMSVAPADGAVDVPVTAEITVTFSESVDAATVNVTTFKVMNGDELVAGAASAGSPTATFTPMVSLEFFTTYTAVLSTGVKDTAGNALAEEYRWSFTTMENPTLWTLEERNSLTDVAVNASGRYVTGPIIESGISTGNLFIAKIHLNGKRGWFEEIATQASDYSCGMAANDDAVYVGRIKDPPGFNDSDVYVDSYDAGTGEFLWSTLVGSTTCRDIAADEATVYLATPHYVFKLDIENGAVVHTLDVDSIGGVITSFNSVAVAVDGNSVYLGGVTTRDLVGGESTAVGGFDFFQWKEPLDQYWANTMTFVPGANLVVLGGQSDLLGEHKAILVAYDSRSGEERFSRVESGVMGSVASDVNAVYVTFGLYSALPAPQRLHSDGSTAWTGSPSGQYGNIAVSNGIVFVTNGTNKLFRYDAETGVMKQ